MDDILKELVKIDIHRLDVEATIQPELFIKYSSELSEAKKLMDLAKFNLELVEAETASYVRDNPEEFGLEKITDKIVSTQVLLSEECKEAKQKLINRKNEVDVLQAAVNALEQKKRMIEQAITLFGQQYFSIPKTRNM